MESIRLSQPAPISEVVLLALEYEEAGWTAEDGPKDELAKDIAKLLVEKAPMLEEYFAIKVDSRGNLCALPEIVHQHAPEMEALPIFLLRLAIEVRRICQVGRYAFNLVQSVSLTTSDACLADQLGRREGMFRWHRRRVGYFLQVRHILTCSELPLTPAFFQVKYHRHQKHYSTLSSRCSGRT